MIPEMKPLAYLIHRASFGLHFSALEHPMVIEKIKTLPTFAPTQKFILWLEILLDLANSSEARQICPEPWMPRNMDTTIQKAILYIQKNLHRDIDQKMVAI